MSSEIDVIRGGYAAFARLDIDDVLGRFADTTEYVDNLALAPHVVAAANG